LCSYNENLNCSDLPREEEEANKYYFLGHVATYQRLFSC